MGFSIGGVEFVSSFDGTSTVDRFFVRKGPELIGRYRALAGEFRGGRIIELGIAAGGSTALLAMLAEPSKLVALEYQAEPVSALDDFVVQHGFEGRVRPYYGVDQADRDTVTRIVDAEFEGPLDLVVDDASHVYEKTVDSFEALFPRLRIGGLYIIEDWAGHYRLAEHVAAASPDRLAELRAAHNPASTPHPPLATMAQQFVLAATGSPDVVAEVAVNQHWLSVRRGPGTFTGLADLYVDYFGWIQAEANRWYSQALRGDSGA